MLRCKKLAKGFILAAAAVWSLNSAAGGGGISGGSTEWTQLMNNAELIGVAAKEAESVAVQTNQYIKQIEQWKIQAQNITKLASLPQGVKEAIAAYKSYEKLRNSIVKLKGTLVQEKNMLESRFDEARLLNMGWEAYQNAVAKDVAANKQQAVVRLEQEDQILKQVEEDYTHARELQDKVPQTEGIHGAMQLMNEQVNKLIVQNAKLMQVIATTTVRDSHVQMTRDAANDEKRRKVTDYMLQQQRAIRQRQLDFGNSTSTPAQ